MVKFFLVFIFSPLPWTIRGYNSNILESNSGDSLSQQHLSQEATFRNTFEQRINALSQEVTTLKQELIKDHMEISSLKQQLSKLTTEHTYYQTDISNLTQQVFKLTTEHEKYQTDINTLKQERAQDQTIISTLSQKVLLDQLDIKSLKQKLIILERERIISQNQTTMLKHQFESSKFDLGMIKSELLELQQYCNQSQKQHGDQHELTMNVSTFHSTVDNIQTELRYLSHFLHDQNKISEQILKNISESVSENRKDLTSLTAKYDNFRNSEFTSRISNLNSFMNSLSTSLQSTQQEQSQVSSVIAQLTKDIQFTAGMTRTITSGMTRGQTLVFSHIITNIGGGYDPSTGIFTSPVEGSFVFHCSLISYENLGAYVNIVLNGTPKTEVLADGSSPYKTASNLVVLHLNRGDRVWVQWYTGNGVYVDTSYHDTFSGFKL